jgi:spore coat polysaccharide biosynthesis protein SpsF
MIIAILQARFSSSRLPGKVLKPILGKPMLELQIERIKRAGLIDRLIVATSNLGDDDPIDDQAVKLSSPLHIVRLTGDCPLCDPLLIDRLIEFHLGEDYDYSSNTDIPTYPDGLDIEVFKFGCLKIAHEEGVLPSQREHVTPFIHQQPHRFKLGSYRSKIDRSHLRWTVDEQLDFELITKIYESLYPRDPEFTTDDILDWLQNNPEWRDHNTRYQRNEGLSKSLLADRAHSLNRSQVTVTKID